MPRPLPFACRDTRLTYTPLSEMQVYLAMEQRENNVELKALSLVSEFAKKFRAIDFTIHPSDIPGECPGKGSNVDWAARKLSEKYSMGCRKDVIITGIDGTSPSLVCIFPVGLCRKPSV